jgi:hypothetical protein
MIRFIFVSIFLLPGLFAADQIHLDEQNKISMPDVIAITKAPVLNLRDSLFELFDNGVEDRPFIMRDGAKWAMSEVDYHALAGYEVEGFPLNWGQLSNDITVETHDVRYTFADEKWKITAKYTVTGACKNFRMCDADRLIPFTLPIVLEHIPPQSGRQIL